MNFLINNSYILFLLVFFSCSDVFEDEAVYGCTDKDACNYNENATENWEGSCQYSVGTCDCDNNPIDDYCNCEGDIDSDFDGLCDNIDSCIGEYDNGYYCSDLHVLDDFKTQNTGSLLDSLTIFEIIDSLTTFNDYGRLTYLSLAYSDIYMVPLSFSKLDSIEKIYLNDNQITVLDSSICDLENLTDLYIYNNQLCDQYKYDCINWGNNNDHWEPQECNE